MRLTRVAVTNFLALPQLELNLDGHRSVITGPNNVGKSTVLTAARLAMAAVSAASGFQIDRLAAEWSDCGHGGSEQFEVRLGLSLEEERELLDMFLRAAYMPLLHWPLSDNGEALNQAIAEALGPAPAAAMAVGELVVKFDRRHRDPWVAGWEFTLPHGPAHVGVLGPTAGEIMDGPLAHQRPMVRRSSELAPSTNDLLARVADGRIRLHLDDVVPGGGHDFFVKPARTGREPADVEGVLAAQTGGAEGATPERITFAAVLDRLLSERLLVTPNHRAAVRTHFKPGELLHDPDISDGSAIPVELHRLKNGTAPMRRRFQEVQRLFEALTGRTFDCLQETFEAGAAQANGYREVTMLLTPMVKAVSQDGEQFDVPLRRAGAGDVEALYLATILSDPDRILMVDEPAVHLSPTAQRRLLALLRTDCPARQVVMVTHNSDLVPVSDVLDLKAIIRLDRNDHRVSANRLPAEVLDKPSRPLKLLASSAVRSVLFASGALLVEGETDLGLIGTWIDAGLPSPRGALPSAEEANLALVSVDGDKSFAPVIDLLSALNIPYAVLADGPSLRPGSPLAKGMSRHALTVPTRGDRLQDVREAWSEVGVFSLAHTFGDDGLKGGEIEAFMERTDVDTLAAIRNDVGAKKGRRVGTAFAAAVDAPAEVAELWADVLIHLGVFDPRHH